jgi:hypothetical protein
MSNVVSLRPPAPPPTILELVDALRTTQEATKLAMTGPRCGCDLPPPLCLSLAYERNRRLLQRMEVSA